MGEVRSMIQARDRGIERDATEKRQRAGAAAPGALDCGSLP